MFKSSTNLTFFLVQKTFLLIQKQEHGLELLRGLTFTKFGKSSCVRIHASGFCSATVTKTNFQTFFQTLSTKKQHFQKEVLKL